MAFFLHSMVISIVVYFHLLLDHKLEMIDDWIYYHGWSLLITSKLLSLYIVMKFVNANISFVDNFRKFERGYKILPDKEIIVIVLFVIMFFVWRGGPVKANYTIFYLNEIVMSFVGSIVFFLSDIFLLHRLNHYYRFKPRTALVMYPIYAVFFFYSFKWTYMYGKNPDLLLMFSFLIGTICVQWKLKRFINAVWYIVSISLINAWCGIGPMWGRDFSPSRMQEVFPISFLVVIFLIVAGYLKLTGRHRFKKLLHM